MMSRHRIAGHPVQDPKDGPTVTVHRRSVYGRVLIYAADADQARHLERMTRRRTLEDADVDALRALGVRVVYDQTGPRDDRAAGISACRWTAVATQRTEKRSRLR
jgi:hypothetical protein